MHVMIDLETMGNGCNAPIVAIGACAFGGDEIGSHFYSTVSLESAVAHGATMDPSTVIWWLKQDDAARAEIVKAGGGMKEALDEFRLYFMKLSNVEGVWGNGAAFDNVILSNAYKRQGENAPWPFWLDRCYRTMKALSDVEVPFAGTKHNALDDAIHQARHLMKITNI